MKFSFMTFSCPELEWAKVVEVARRFGYEGVEPRAQAGHRHGIEPEASPRERAAARKAAEDAGVEIACLATSCRYVLADPGERAAMVEESRRLIELADEVGAGRMRVFGGNIPEGMSREEAAAVAAESLRQVGEEAGAAGVVVCVETHDAWRDARHLASLLRAVDHPNVQANWDIMHPVRAGMTIDEAFAAIGPWVRHCHFHDGKEVEGRFRLCPVGEGVVDHRRAVELLRGAGYEGFLSGEWINWEDGWEEHLPRELARIRSYL